MPADAVTLYDRRGATRLALAVQGYADPDATADGSAWGEANRLRVALEVELSGRSWRSVGPLLCSGDLSALIAWTRLVAQGRLVDPYVAADPGLGLSGRRHGEMVLLRVRLGDDLAPAFLDAQGLDGSEGVVLPFRLATRQVVELADALEGWQLRFPRR